DSRRADAGEIRSARSDDCVEVPLGPRDDGRLPLPGLLGAEWIRLDDDDLPAGKLERPGVDPREAELAHTARPGSPHVEEPRRGGGGESGRQPAHGYPRYMTKKRTGKFLGVPYDWRRPTVARYKSRWWNPGDRRIVTPRAFGWGYDFNLAEVA